MEDFDNYNEEEEVTYLTIDDNFCHVMDTSILKAVSQVVAPPGDENKSASGPVPTTPQTE